MYSSRCSSNMYSHWTPQKLDEIDQDLEDFKYSVKTQAVVELMNYRGINDWGEVR